MHSLEFNKFTGAVLVALLLTVGISKLGSVIYNVDSPDEMSYIVETDEPSGSEVEDTTPAMSFDQILAMADPAGGERISRKCVSCHTFAEGDTTTKQGPSLWNIVGRDVASVSGYDYSSALSDLGGAWTYERLNEFIADARTYAPGTKMTFAGISDMTERAELVAFLRTLSADPVPLPDVEIDVGGAEVDGEDVGEMDSEQETSDSTMEGINDIVSDTVDAASDVVDDASDAVEDAADSASDAIDSATGSESSDN